MRVTAKDIENLIQEAKEAGAEPTVIQELQEHLLEIKSEALMSNSNATFRSESIGSEGRKVVTMSTAPISLDDNNGFEGVNLKPVKAKQHPDS